MVAALSRAHAEDLWPTDKLTALRLVTEVDASGPGRRAFVEIRPVAETAADAQVQGWTRSGRDRTSKLEHWDYDADQIAGFDYDIGAIPGRWLVAAFLREGCKGHRWYGWAWIATSSPTHWVLVRRHPDDDSKVTFFRCHAPHGATLATLVRIAGRRWPVETYVQAAKSILGIDAHQVGLWHSWHRHTTLALSPRSYREARRSRRADCSSW